MTRLFTYSNKKILKSKEKGYLTAGLHLSPGKVCVRASAGCLKACLNTSGFGRYRNVQEARARKTKMFWDDPEGFLKLIGKEVEALVRKAKREKLKPAVRLNLTSDIPWECYGVPQSYPDVQFYDYTKYHDRCPPPNYHLTFSRSESVNNWVQGQDWLAKGNNVAVVFKDELPKKYWGAPVIDGDEHDLRFLDPTPSIVGLTAKAKAKHDKTGFVVEA